MNDFYCATKTASGRKQKTCTWCEGTIGIGKPAMNIPGEGFDTTYHFHIGCYETVTNKFNTLDECLSAKYADEGSEDEDE